MRQQEDEFQKKKKGELAKKRKSPEGVVNPLPLDAYGGFWSCF